MHQGQPVIHAGKPLSEAQAAMILVHGRGDNAHNFITLSQELHHPAFAYLAPQAADNTWYPYSFLAPMEQNEPGISTGIAAIGELVAHIEAAGLPAEQIILGGFSQGACLTLEFVARNARRYGGVFAYSGGLIGPDGTARDYPGTLDGTPVFIGCSDVDFHIPKERVLESEQALRDLGGAVTATLYPGMGHTINAEEINIVREMMALIS